MCVFIRFAIRLPDPAGPCPIVNWNLLNTTWYKFILKKKKKEGRIKEAVDSSLVRRPLPSNELRLTSRSVIKIVAFISMENIIYDGNGESIEPRWNGLSTSEKEELAGLELKRTTQWRPGPPRGRQGRWYEASLIRPCACCKNFPGAGSSTRVIHSWIKIAPVALRSVCTSQNRNYARRGEGVPLDCPSTFNADRTRKNFVLLSLFIT